MAWSWVGGVTEDSVTVTVRLDASASEVVLRYTKDPYFLTGLTDSAPVVPDANNVAKVTVSGLDPRTRYLARPVIDGVEAPDGMIARWYTFPPALEVASFSIAHGGDSSTGSTHAAHEQIARRRPLMFCHLGDFHYENIGVNNPGTFRAAYDAVLASGPQALLLRATPTAYVWDDHDYGPDNSDSTAVGRAAAHEVYRQMVPHYPLAGGGITPIYQAWSIGRVRFILTDLRTERTPNSATDDASKTMLGAAQKAWFKAELQAARDAGYRAVVWLNSQVWPTEQGEGSLGADPDHWGQFTTERTELSDFILDEGIPEVVILSGDAHMLAAKSNALYASDGTQKGVTVFQAAAMGHPTGHTRGASWELGPTGGTGQFGWLNVRDNPEGLVLDWAGIQSTTEGVCTEIMRYQKRIGTATPATSYYFLDGAAAPLELLGNNPIGPQEIFVKDTT